MTYDDSECLWVDMVDLRSNLLTDQREGFVLKSLIRLVVSDYPESVRFAVQIDLLKSHSDKHENGVRKNGEEQEFKV